MQETKSFGLFIEQGHIGFKRFLTCTLTALAVLIGTGTCIYAESLNSSSGEENTGSVSSAAEYTDVKVESQLIYNDNILIQKDYNGTFVKTSGDTTAILTVPDVLISKEEIIEQQKIKAQAELTEQHQKEADQKNETIQQAAQYVVSGSVSQTVQEPQELVQPEPVTDEEVDKSYQNYSMETVYRISFGNGFQIDASVSVLDSTEKGLVVLQAKDIRPEKTAQMEGRKTEQLDRITLYGYTSDDAEEQEHLDGSIVDGQDTRKKLQFEDVNDAGQEILKGSPVMNSNGYLIGIYTGMGEDKYGTYIDSDTITDVLNTQKLESEWFYGKKPTWLYIMSLATVLFAGFVLYRVLKEMLIIIKKKVFR